MCIYIYDIYTYEQSSSLSIIKISTIIILVPPRSQHFAPGSQIGSA